MADRPLTPQQIAALRSLPLNRDPVAPASRASYDVLLRLSRRPEPLVEPKVSIYGTTWFWLTQRGAAVRRTLDEAERLAACV